MLSLSLACFGEFFAFGEFHAFGEFQFLCNDKANCAPFETSKNHGPKHTFDDTSVLLKHVIKLIYCFYYNLKRKSESTRLKTHLEKKKGKFRLCACVSAQRFSCFCKGFCLNTT